jgi:hypothetical protein
MSPAPLVFTSSGPVATDSPGDGKVGGKVATEAEFDRIERETECEALVAVSVLCEAVRARRASCYVIYFFFHYAYLHLPRRLLLPAHALRPPNDHSVKPPHH